MTGRVQHDSTRGESWMTKTGSVHATFYSSSTNVVVLSICGGKSCRIVWSSAGYAAIKLTAWLVMLSLYPSLPKGDDDSVSSIMRFEVLFWKSKSSCSRPELVGQIVANFLDCLFIHIITMVGRGWYSYSNKSRFADGKLWSFSPNTTTSDHRHCWGFLELNFRQLTSWLNRLLAEDDDWLWYLLL